MSAWHNPKTEQRRALSGGSSLAFTGILVGYRDGGVRQGRWRT